jgi:hypothetical protein
VARQPRKRAIEWAAGVQAEAGPPSDGTPGRSLFVGQQLDVQIDAAAR